MPISLPRRAFLTGAAIAAGAACSPMPPAMGGDSGSGGLDAIARRSGRRFGSAFAWAPDRGSFANPAYAELLRRDCGMLVGENEMKWQALRPAPDRFDFARYDAMAAWAREQGMPLRGHTLLWAYTRWFPAWLNTHDFGARPASEGARILDEHIRAVIGRYGAQTPSWDVVNEAVDPDTSELRVTSLSRAMGGTEAVLDHAFRTARAAAPSAELVYNDYMSWEVGNEKHRAGVLRLLEGFRRRGVPVDTLGVQSHIGIFDQTDDVGALAARLSPEWRRFCDRVVEMGYRMVLTEFDVRDRGLPRDEGVRDRGVADFASAYLDIMLSYPQTGDLLAWGMSDRYSWLRGFEPRADGAITRGSPYDAEMRAKPIYDAIAAALAGAVPVARA